MKPGTRLVLVYYLAAALVAFLAFLWTYKTVRIVYAINDDVSLREIASGSLSGVPDGHLIYVQYALGWAISRLFVLNAQLDWYGITMLGLMGLCLLLVLFRVLELAATYRRKIAGTVLVLLGYALLGLRHVAAFQYTTVSAVLAGTAVFWLAASGRQTGFRRFADPAICALLLLASYMVRANVFLMCLPFAALAFLYRNVEWETRRIHGLWLPAAVLAGVGIVFLAEQGAYRSPEWKAYLQLNELRTQIFDYVCLLRYDSNAAFYRSIGVSSAAYDLLQRYTLAPNPAANVETYRAIVARCIELKAADLASTPRLSRLHELTFALFTSMLGEQYALARIVCLLLFSFVVAIRWRDFGTRDALLVFSIVTIHFGVWLYLIANGRYPERVIWALYLIEALLLSGLALPDLLSLSFPGKVALRVAFVLFAIVLAAGVADFQVQAIRQIVSSKAAVNKACERVHAYTVSHPQNFYFLPIRSFSSCTRTFTVLEDDRFVNSSPMGGWELLSPLTKQNWDRNAITDVQQDLIRRDNVLILVKPPDSIDYVVNYYHSIGLNVAASEADHVNMGDDSAGAIVYRLQVVKDAVP